MFGKKSILIVVALTGVQFVYGMEEFIKTYYTPGNEILSLDCPTDPCTLDYRLLHDAMRISRTETEESIRARTALRCSASHWVPFGDDRVAVVYYCNKLIEVRKKPKVEKIVDLSELSIEERRIYFRSLTGENIVDFRAPADVTCILPWKKKKLIFGCVDGAIGIWNTETDETTYVSKGHNTDEVLRLATLEGDRLASEERNGTKKLWDLTCFRDDLSLEEKKLYRLCSAEKKRNNETKFLPFFPWFMSCFYQGYRIADDKEKSATFKTFPDDIKWRTIERKWVSLSRDERRQLGIPKRRRYLDTDGTLKDLSSLSKKDD